MRALKESVPEAAAGTLTQMFDDWLKTLRWISSHIKISNLESTKDQTRRKELWMEVGAALGFDNRLFLCGNPRCPGGDFANVVCDHCKEIAYCSPRCQTM